MVQIPIAKSTGRLTTQTPSRVDPGSFSQSSRALTQLGRTLTAVGEQLRKVRSATQMNEASNLSLRTLEQTRIDYEQDPDILDEKVQNGYLSRFRSSGRAASSLISDGNDRTNFSALQEQDAILAEFKFKDFVQKRQMDRSKEVLNNTFDTVLDAAINARNEKEAEIFARRFDVAADRDITIGAVDKAAAEISKKELREQIKFGRAKAIAVNLPEAFLKDSGKFGLSIDEQEELTRLANVISNNNAQRAARDQQKTYTQTSRDRTLELYSPDRDDAAYLEKIEKDFTDGLMSEGTFVAKRNVVVSGTGMKAINDPATINPISLEAVRLASKDVDGLYINATAEDMAEFEALFQTISRASAAKKITPGRVNEILSPLFPIIDKVLDDSAREQLITDNPRKGIEKVFFWADNFSEGDVDQVKADMTRKLFSTIFEKNANVDEEVNKVIKEQQDLMHPEWSGKKIGDSMETVFGTRKIKGFFPDGEPDVELLPEDMKALERRKLK